MSKHGKDSGPCIWFLAVGGEMEDVASEREEPKKESELITKDRGHARSADYLDSSCSKRKSRDLSVRV